MTVSRSAGKTPVVSGAGAGVGQPIALRFAQNGARVVLADLTEEKETRARCAAIGAQAVAVLCGVSTSDSVMALRREMNTKAFSAAF